MFEFLGSFIFFKRFESLFEVICSIQSVSWAWIPMRAFGQDPLKQGRSGRSSFIAGFVRPRPASNQKNGIPIRPWKVKGCDAVAERKSVLDALRNALRSRGFLPIVFWKRPAGNLRFAVHAVIIS